MSCSQATPNSDWLSLRTFERVNVTSTQSGCFGVTFTQVRECEVALAHLGPQRRVATGEIVADVHWLVESWLSGASRVHRLRPAPSTRCITTSRGASDRRFEPNLACGRRHGRGIRFNRRPHALHRRLPGPRRHQQATFRHRLRSRSPVAVSRRNYASTGRLGNQRVGRSNTSTGPAKSSTSWLRDDNHGPRIGQRGWRQCQSSDDFSQIRLYRHAWRLDRRDDS